MRENDNQDKKDHELKYSFSKSQGILIKKTPGEKLEVYYRGDASPGAILELRRFLKKPFDLHQVNEEEFTNILSKMHESKSGATSQLAENIQEKMDLSELAVDLPNTSDLLENKNEAPIVNLLNVMFSEAIKQKASDIHLETFERLMCVRFRIDGVLQTVLDLPHVLGPLIVSRIKVMSKLNIAEKRLPQDGRITIKIAGAPVDVRVSTIPATHGERVVLRILNKRDIHLKLDELGMNEKPLLAIREMIARPHGIILVTGPTGAGKTTTLYAMLTELNKPGNNILTVEDPVEFDLHGIGQIQVNTKIDMTFAKGLRAILRQDPDIIMVGEIRDLETATIAVQSSLTGHLVLSTLHTNTAIGAITRLRDMGIEPFLLSTSLIGVIAQRLVRLLCPHCKTPYPATREACQFMHIPAENPPVIYKAVGCEHCANTGYKGRNGIYEAIILDEDIRAMIHDNVSEGDMTKYAHARFPSIREDGVMQILRGSTTIEEVIRVTSE